MDKNYIKHLSNLAKLQFTDKEEEELLISLNEMLQFVEKLQEVDTLDLAPLKHVSTETISVRSDEIKLHSPLTETFKNAPKHENNYFLVPKVIQQ